jgi:predicted nucleic acid-binding protein
LRVTFDSNILVYAVDSDGGEKHSIAADLIARAAHGDCVFTLQSLTEFFFVATRKAMLDAATAAAFVDAWRAVYPVVAAEEGALVSAMAAVRSHRLSFWDAMIWATARQADCQILVSEDLQDGRTLEGVRFVNPFAPQNAALIETALPQAPRS